MFKDRLVGPVHPGVELAAGVASDGRREGTMAVLAAGPDRTRGVETGVRDPWTRLVVAKYDSAGKSLGQGRHLYGNCLVDALDNVWTGLDVNLSVLRGGVVEHLGNDQDAMPLHGGAGGEGAAEPYWRHVNGLSSPFRHRRDGAEGFNHTGR